MQTKDTFDPVHPLPRFLAEPGTGSAPDGAVTTSPVFKASILIAAAAATGIAVLALGNPAALFADVSASLVGNSSPQPAPTVQPAADVPASFPTTADAQTLPPATRDAPARDEIAASEPTGKDQAENGTSSSETLFRQFQAWAAEKDAQVHGGPIQPVQDTSAQVVRNPLVQNAPAPAAESVRVPNRLVQKRRQVRAVNNARAEMRTQNLRKQVRQAQRAPTERPPVQDARAQEQSVQDAQAPSLLLLFGLRN